MTDTIRLYVSVKVKNTAEADMHINELAAILIENLKAHQLLSLGWTLEVEVEHEPERPVVAVVSSPTALTVQCPTCNSEAGYYCVTKKGRRCSPHKARWKVAAGK